MNQIFGLFLIIMAIALGAFFIQSGQLGSLNFGKIDFGVPLQSLGESPILQYRSPDGTLITSKTNPPSGSGAVSGGSGSVSPPSVGMPQDAPSPRFSEFYGRVKMGTVKSNQISLRANFQSGEKINITGWYIKARNGGWYVPKAVNIYDPSGLAEPGDILLGRGETVNMYSGSSPLGVNFRLNLCTGYLNNDRKFSPTLPRQCPGADKATLRNFSSQCQDFVPGAVSSCKEPRSNPPLPYYDEGCLEYLELFSFKGCFDTYRSEPGFLKPEWRVWMGTTFVNARHDRVFLLDTNGFVIDWREY